MEEALKRDAAKGWRKSEATDVEKPKEQLHAASAQ